MTHAPRPFSHPSARRSRTGSAYLLVLMTVLIVTAIGLSAVALSRIELRRSSSASDALAARAAARAAIEFGFLKIRLESNWNNIGDGPANWASNVPFQNGTYSLTRTGYDNSDPINYRITLLATGTSATAVYKLQIVIVRGAWVDSAGITQVVN